MAHSVAKILGVSRNTVKKYWEGQTVPWERKPGSGRKNDIITDEVKTFIIKCIESDKEAPRKQHHTAHKIYERLVAEYGFEGCEASVRRTVAELRCYIHDIFVPLSYRRLNKQRNVFPSDTALLKALYLATHEIAQYPLYTVKKSERLFSSRSQHNVFITVFKFTEIFPQSH